MTNKKLEEKKSLYRRLEESLEVLLDLCQHSGTMHFPASVPASIDVGHPIRCTLQRNANALILA